MPRRSLIRRLISVDSRLDEIERLASELIGTVRMQSEQTLATTKRLRALLELERQRRGESNV